MNAAMATRSTLCGSMTMAIAGLARPTSVSEHDREHGGGHDREADRPRGLGEDDQRESSGAAAEGFDDGVLAQLRQCQGEQGRAR